ncbi:MAG: hypothetical protein ABEJ91_02250 [Candidatus Nanohaloarchaea archaeon]
MSEGNEIFGVETVEDDVFGTGDVVDSFAYSSGGAVREVYLSDVDSVSGKLLYEVKEFGNRNEDAVLETGRVDVEDASEAEAVYSEVVESDSNIDPLIDEDAENLEGLGTADAFSR